MRFWSNEKLSDQDFRQINFELVIFQWTVISFPPGEVHPIGLGGERFFDHPVIMCCFFVHDYHGVYTGWSKKCSPPGPIGCTSPGGKLMTIHWNITNSKFICRKSWSESLSLLQNRIFCKKGISMGGIGICAYWQHLPLDSPSLWDN